MIKRLIFFLPLIAFGGVSNQVAVIVNSVDTHLQSASVALTLAENDCKNCLYNLEQFADNNPSAVNVSSASNFYYAVTNCESTLVNIQLAQDQISRARGKLNLIPGVADAAVTNIVIVHTNVTIQVTTNACSDCSSKLDYIIDGLEQTYLAVENNALAISAANTGIQDIKSGQVLIRQDMAALSRSLASVSNLIQQARLEGHNERAEYYTSITNALGGADQGSGDDSGGGESGCGCVPWLQQILQVLEDCYWVLYDVDYLLNGWDVPLTSYLDFYNSLQSEIENYYNLLNRRYSHFDSRLPQGLSLMFFETLRNIDKVSNRFRLNEHSPLDSVDDLINSMSGSDMFELSNEGLIGLYSASVLDRSYLTQVQILEAITNQTNNLIVDLSWLEDYLLKVQRPYYELWNDEYKHTPAFTRFGPYSTVPNITAIGTPRSTMTNFFNNASPDVNDRGRQYYSWRRAQTNWFDRVETLLLGLNGMLSFDTVADDPDKSEFDNLLESSTNEVSSLAGMFDGYSNGVYEVVGAFTNCLNSFRIEVSEGNNVIRIFDGGEYFMTYWDPIQIEYSQLEDITDPVRRICTFLWIVTTSFGAFVFFVFFCGLVVRVVARLIGLIRGFMAPS